MSRAIHIGQQPRVFYGIPKLHDFLYNTNDENLPNDTWTETLSITGSGYIYQILALFIRQLSNSDGYIAPFRIQIDDGEFYENNYGELVMNVQNMNRQGFSGPIRFEQSFKVEIIRSLSRSANKLAGTIVYSLDRFN